VRCDAVCGMRVLHSRLRAFADATVGGKVHVEHKCENEKWIGSVEEWRKAVDEDRRRFNIHDEEANRDGGNREQLRDCVKTLDFITRSIPWIVACTFIVGFVGGIVGVILAVSTPAGKSAIGYLVGLLR
jgi:hypothetical protein